MHDMSKENKDSWFRKCVFTNERRLIRYTMKLIATLEPSKEIVQESFLKLWKQNFPNSSPYYPVAWLYRVSRNAAIDYIRQNKGKEYLEDASELISTPCLNEKLLEKSIILKTIKKLPKKQQKVMVLKFQEDLSYQEISEITGLSGSNVGYLIHESIKALREILGITKE